MRKSGLLFGVVLAATTVASGASAARVSADNSGIAEKGTLTFGAERMFGFGWSQESTETVEVRAGSTTTQENKISGTTFGLLWNPAAVNALGAVNPAVNPYLVPRVGVDYTFLDNMTLGGSIGFAHLSASSSRTTTTTTANASSTQSVSGDWGSGNAFVLSPRFGYVLPLSGAVGLWLRGGFTYYNVGTTVPVTRTGDTQINTTQNGFALSLDPQLVLSPVDHFAFTVGLAVDIPLAGSVNVDTITNNFTTSTSNTDHFTNIGATVGLIGWL